MYVDFYSCWVFIFVIGSNRIKFFLNPMNNSYLLPTVYYIIYLVATFTSIIQKYMRKTKVLLTSSWHQRKLLFHKHRSHSIYYWLVITRGSWLVRLQLVLYFFHCPKYESSRGNIKIIKRKDFQEERFSRSSRSSRGKILKILKKKDPQEERF